MRFKTALIPATVILALAVSALPALAQNESNLASRSSASADFTANLQSEATNSGVKDRASYSGGLMLNYRYQFHGRSSVEANGAFTTFTQYYQPAQTQEQANIYEVSGAYVYRLRGDAARLKPFIEAGGGMILFSPVRGGSTSGGKKQYLPTFLYGGGFDWRVKKKIFVRLGYRGLFYHAPDFHDSPEQTTNTLTHMAEPYIGVVLHF